MAVFIFDKVDDNFVPVFMFLIIIYCESFNYLKIFIEKKFGCLVKLTYILNSVKKRVVSLDA